MDKRPEPPHGISRFVLEKVLGVAGWKWLNEVLDRDDEQTARAGVVYRKCGGE